MLTNSSEYAIRAVLHLARTSEGAHVAAGTVAESLGLPGDYLAKILQRLARRDVVESARGPRGGFRLRVEPERLSLKEVVEPFQDLARSQRCLLRDARCREEGGCPVHERWAEVLEEVESLFRDVTVGDLLPPVPGDEEDGG